MSDSRKIVAVLGATGLQGGSVVKELLKHPSRYAIRGLTRNRDSEKAKALAQQGVEVVTADLNDHASLEQAFAGTHIIYAMTDFWDQMSFDVEYNQGKSIADIAANIPQLEHLIWAALPDGRRISEGRYTHIYHWQSKAAVTDYIREEKTRLWAKTTAVLFPNYFENCLTNPPAYLPVKHDDGVYVRKFVTGVDTELPNVAIADTGKLIVHVLENSTEFFKRTIAFYSQAISEGEKLEYLGKFHNIPVRYEQISQRQFQDNLEAHMSPICALDYAEQLKIFDECGMIYARPEFVQANQIPGLRLQTWEDFVQTSNLLERMSVSTKSHQ